MKKVLIDVNILDKEKIQKIFKNNLLNKKGNLLKFYISEIALKQRLIKLYYSDYSMDYDLYIDFIKTFCEPSIINASVDIAKREIDNNFIPAKITSNFKTHHLNLRNQAKLQLDRYKEQLNNDKKKDVGDSYKDFIKKEKQNISKLQSSKDWEIYCYDFVNRYKFAVKEMQDFLNVQEKFNKEIYFSMVKLWWKYATIAGVLRFFNTPNADNQAINIIKKDLKLSKKCFLYRQIQADDFILDYTLMKDKKFDYDSPNDVIYLAIMKDFDILLTDDQSFMKDCFNTMYPNKNKKILTLNEFIKRYK